jgi:hypothetical protein
MHIKQEVHKTNLTETKLASLGFHQLDPRLALHQITLRHNPPPPDVLNTKFPRTNPREKIADSNRNTPHVRLYQLR